MGKDIHENSTQSYDEEKECGNTDIYRKRVLDTYAAAGVPLTDREVLTRLAVKDVNNVRPEITRLKQDKLIEEVDRVKCPVTGKPVRRCTITGSAYAPRRTRAIHKDEEPSEYAGKALNLAEKVIVGDLERFVRECDADSLAALYGHAFGLDVSSYVRDDEDNLYVCTPIDGKYCGHREKELKETVHEKA